MQSKVFFKSVNDGDAEAISAAGRGVLEALLAESKVGLAAEVPLKVHFGERGNRTYLRQDFFAGIIDLLEENNSRGSFMETSVLYGGERYTSEKHIKLAHSHGFDRLPVVMADGESGGDAVLVPVPCGKFFKSATIARKLAEAEQTIVLSHFKGHMLAGFGGAVKQLSMGFAAKGGKMAMHLNVKPSIRAWRCKNCGLCVSRCNEKAITQKGRHYVIDRSKCIGCGACFSICPHRAVSVFNFGGLWNALFKGRFFREKLVEYAWAAHNGKKNIYINFVVNVTPGCDCEPRPMRKCVPDIGVLASLDPVAVDAACYDLVAAGGKKFRGREQLNYAEKISLGTQSYQLVEL